MYQGTFVITGTLHWNRAVEQTGGSIFFYRAAVILERLQHSAQRTDGS